MKWLMSLILIACSFASNALSGEVRPGVFRTPDERFKKLHVVLLADEKDHGPAGNGLHDYPLWQKRWALLLGGEEASEEKQANLVGPPEKDADYRNGMPHVELATAWHWPSEEQFQTADVIVAYCYLEWTDQRLAQVRRYLEDGGGLVLIHSATWTKPKPSREVAEVVGVGGFRLFRHGDVRLEMLAPEHPICAGLPKTIILKDDETYWPPTPIMESVTVLAASVEDKAKRGSTPRAAQPMFWCYELGEGRVFGCVPGHSAKTFDDPVLLTSNIVTFLTKFSSGGGVKLLQGYMLRASQGGDDFSSFGSYVVASAAG